MYALISRSTNPEHVGGEGIDHAVDRSTAVGLSSRALCKSIALAGDSCGLHIVDRRLTKSQRPRGSFREYGLHFCDNR